MGAVLAKIEALHPADLAAFKNLPPSAKIEIPELSENRVATDKYFIIVLVLFIVISLPFSIYTLSYSDVDRYNGVDSCGNVCGKVNPKHDGFNCSGLDTTNKRFLQVNNTNIPIYLASRECVSECSEGYEEASGYCLKHSPPEVVDDLWSTLGNYLNSATWRIVIASLISSVLGVMVLFLFHLATSIMVWVVLVGVLCYFAAGAGASAYFYTQTEGKSKRALLVLAIGCLLIMLVLVGLMIYFRKKIALVIVLLKESSKATSAMPGILFVPVVMFILELIIVAASCASLIYFFSAGILTKEEESGFTYVIYKHDVVMIITLVLNCIVIYWVVQFVTGVHYMIIAGAVSKWYFAKDKKAIGSPIIASIYVAFRFHLGSVAFGTMMLVLVAIIRQVIDTVTRNKGQTCTAIIERVAKFLSKNAFIITAMHSEPFFKSGKRAVQIVIQNIVNIAAINFIMNYIVFMAQLLVVLLSVLVTFLVMRDADHSYVALIYVIVVVVSGLVVIICFSMHETMIGTIFLCFCEDCMLNNGTTKPYAMSTDLMEFMDESKKVFPKDTAETDDLVTF